MGVPIDLLRDLVQQAAWVNPGVPVVRSACGIAAEKDAALIDDTAVRRLDEMLGHGSRQVMIQTGSIVTGAAVPGLSRKQFHDVATVVGMVPETCRAHGGLWTSSELVPGTSSWDLWMADSPYDNAMVGPTYRWHVTPQTSPRVIELRGAADWVRFATRFAAPGGQYDHIVDWREVIKYADAVHISLTCALATQGTSFQADDHRWIAPPYFDAESTLWLTWVFRNIEPA